MGDRMSDAELSRIRSGLGRIEGRTVENQIIRDMVSLLLEVDRLRAQVAALRELLADLEWSASGRDHGEEVSMCPSCSQPYEHASDCRLAAALAESTVAATPALTP